MKKLLTISILFVMVLAMCTSIVSATTKAELPDQLFAIGSKYGATAAHKIKIERYIADNDLTDAQATAIVAKANEISAIMDAANITDPRKLSAEDKAKVKSIANEAASIAGVSLVFKSNDVEIFKNGKKLDSVNSPLSGSASSTSNGSSTSSTTSSKATSGKKLVYTGSNSYVAIAAGTTAVVALATIVIIKKKVVNA